MNVATVTKQQNFSGVNNQDETPLAFAGQRASLTPQADTVSFSSQTQTQTQTQPQFGANKWLLTLAAPFLPLLFTNCDRPEPGDEPTPINMPTEPFTDGQPYTTETDLTYNTSRILTSGGQTPNTQGYQFDSYDDSRVLAALENDWEDNNLPHTLRDTLRNRYLSDSFKNGIAHNSGDMAYIALSGFREPSSQENIDLNNNLLFITDPQTSPGFYWNSERPGWAPTMPEKSNFHTYRNWNGNQNNDVVLVNDLQDGVNGDLLAGGLENEAEELRYNTEEPPEIAQACEDLVAFLRTAKVWNDQTVKDDTSPYGLIRKDQMIRLGLTGFDYTAEKEFLLDNKYGFWPGAKESPSGENILEEGFLSSKPSLTPENVGNAPGSYDPGAQRIAEIEEVIGKPLPNGVLDSDAYITIKSAINDWVNSNDAFKTFLTNELGPLEAHQE